MERQPDTLEKAYGLRFETRQAYRNAVWSVLCADFFQRYIPESGAVLDLGSGWGEFLNHIRAAQKTGLDLNPEAGRRLGKAIRFLHQDCALPWDVPGGSLDAVFTSNFLEHLPARALLDKALEEAHRSLKPGGVILCMGPNIRYLPGAYWDFWDHILPLTDRSLAEALQLAGFAVVRQSPRFLPYSMSTGFQPPLAFLRLYLRLPFLWPLFGKQFLVIARKPLQDEACG